MKNVVFYHWLVLTFKSIRLKGRNSTHANTYPADMIKKEPPGVSVQKGTQSPSSNWSTEHKLGLQWTTCATILPLDVLIVSLYDMRNAIVFIHVLFDSILSSTYTHHESREWKSIRLTFQECYELQDSINFEQHANKIRIIFKLTLRHINNGHNIKASSATEK